MADHGKYFSRKELECHCGCGKCDMDDMFLERLDMLRNRRGSAIRINSAYRCSEHNADVGGVPNSAHTKGIAVDISTLDGQEQYELMMIAFDMGFTGIGVANTFLHIDDKKESPRPNVWTY